MVNYEPGSEPAKLIEAVRKSQGGGLLFAHMSASEKKWARLLASHGTLRKGRADTKQGGVAYFIA